MFSINTIFIFLFGLIIGSFLNFKYIIKSRELISGWVFLGSSFFGFMLLYLFTNEYQFAVNHTALSRNILTLTPISIVIAAISFKKQL